MYLVTTIFRLPALVALFQQCLVRIWHVFRYTTRCPTVCVGFPFYCFFSFECHVLGGTVCSLGREAEQANTPPSLRVRPCVVCPRQQQKTLGRSRPSASPRHHPKQWSDLLAKVNILFLFAEGIDSLALCLCELAGRADYCVSSFLPPSRFLFPASPAIPLLFRVAPYGRVPPPPRLAVS